ncbi:MAG: terminase family protein [Bacteroidota bacterium]
MSGSSIAEQVARLAEAERAAVLSTLTTDELASWAFWARPNQVAPPGDWFGWLLLAGRGFGKTRTAAEHVAEQARAMHGGRGALVAATLDDVRDTMVEGESGLLAVLERAYGVEVFRDADPEGAWNRTKVELYLSNGFRFKGFSSERARKLRGPQHHIAWCDEISSWTDAHLGTERDTTWSNLMLGLRLGERPRVVVTTTPKPNRLTRQLKALVDGARWVLTTGSTYDNLGNLSPTFKANVLDAYEGTSLGRQELHAELLDEAAGALWTRELLRAAVVADLPGEVVSIAVGLDPSVGDGSGDTCGIIVAVSVRVNGRLEVVIVADETLRGTPGAWAKRVVRASAEHAAGEVIAEKNQGGLLIRRVLEAEGLTVPVRLVIALKSKADRAKNFVHQYERGMVHHLPGLAKLEDEQVTWEPGVSKWSPGRIDAAGHVVRELLARSTAQVAVSVF